MKKFVLLVLISSILFPSWLFIASMEFQRKAIQREIKKSIIPHLSENQLVKIGLLKSEKNLILIWKHSTEFEFNGRMFDVVKTKLSSDSIYYFCWEDKKETELNNNLKIFVAKTLEHNEQESGKLIRLQNFLSSFYYEDSDLYLYINQEQNNEYELFDIPILQQSFPPHSPPPKI